MKVWYSVSWVFDRIYYSGLWAYLRVFFGRSTVIVGSILNGFGIFCFGSGGVECIVFGVELTRSTFELRSCFKFYPRNKLGSKITLQDTLKNIDTIFLGRAISIVSGLFGCIGDIRYRTSVVGTRGAREERLTLRVEQQLAPCLLLLLRRVRFYLERYFGGRVMVSKASGSATVHWYENKLSIKPT